MEKLCSSDPELVVSANMKDMYCLQSLGLEVHQLALTVYCLGVEQVLALAPPRPTPDEDSEFWLSASNTDLINLHGIATRKQALYEKTKSDLEGATTDDDEDTKHAVSAMLPVFAESARKAEEAFKSLLLKHRSTVLALEAQHMSEFKAMRQELLNKSVDAALAIVGKAKDKVSMI